MAPNQNRRRNGQRRPQQRPRPQANGHRTAPNGTPETPDINTTGRTLSTEKVILFRINRHAYEVDAEPTQGMVLRVIHEMRTRGDMYGIDLAMELLLGEEDYRRYMDVIDYLSDEEHEKLANAVEAHLLGAKERLGKG